MNSVRILGVRIDPVTLDQAADQVTEWLKGKKKRFICTPNVEFLMLAQKDDSFRSILNSSDLAIPDSARLSWAYSVLSERNYVKKIMKWWGFLFPAFFTDLPVTTGVDLMERLCQISAEKGFRIGLLGGKDRIAEKAAECLVRKYPGLKVSYAISGGEVNKDGGMVNAGPATRQPQPTSSVRSTHLRGLVGAPPGSPLETRPHFVQDPRLASPALDSTDILFVAFGQGKQEKWIKNYMDKVPARVFMGVGGAFDYLSGEIERAPVWIRKIGFEWLFRLVKQPWRIKRFGALVRFIFLTL